MTLGKREFSAEAKSAIAVMRSLIISEKGTSSLFRILGDYRKEEGHPLMYKNFGYPTAIAFLEASGEFILREQNGEVVILVKPSENSNHIAKMIAAQKSSKPRAAPKKPVYSTTWKNTPYQTNRYPAGQFQPSYQQRQQNFPYQQQTKQYYSHQQQPVNPVGSYQQQVRPATTSYRLQQLQTKPSTTSYQQNQRYNNRNNPLSLFFNYGVKAAPYAPRQTTTAPRAAVPPTPTPPAKPNNSTNPFLQAPTNPFAKPVQPVVKPAPAPVPAVAPIQSTPQIAPKLADDPKMDTFENQQPTPVVRTIRQSFKAPVAAQQFTPESIVRVVQDQQLQLQKQQQQQVKKNVPASPAAPSVAPFDWELPGMKPEDVLVKYGCSHGIVPEFRSVRIKTGFLCSVKVNGKVYSSYPVDYATEQEGKSAVARIAIDAIREAETRRYREYDGTDAEIAKMIYDLLLPCQYGMQLDNVPNAFRALHNLLIPNHWRLIIQANSLFETEEIANRVIVFAAKPSVQNITPSAEAQRMSANTINLPWDEEYWSVYVTHPVSPDEIWARIVGPEYSGRMDDLWNDIERTMEGGTKRKPASVKAGEYYLTQLDNSWHRVRVETVESTVKCFFVDIGGSCRVPLNLIFECEARFLELPAQAVRFSLEGLQGVGDNRVVEYLQESVRGNVLIGEVHTSMKEYEASRPSNSPLRVTLYDTSSDECDVCINDVLKGLCEETPER